MSTARKFGFRPGAAKFDSMVFIQGRVCRRSYSPRIKKKDNK
jgi:hypothetical protein